MSEKGGFTLMKILKTNWAIATVCNCLQKHWNKGSVLTQFSWVVCMSMNSLKLLSSTLELPNVKNQIMP